MTILPGDLVRVRVNSWGDREFVPVVAVAGTQVYLLNHHVPVVLVSDVAPDDHQQGALSERLDVIEDHVRALEYETNGEGFFSKLWPRESGAFE